MTIAAQAMTARPADTIRAALSAGHSRCIVWPHHGVSYRDGAPRYGSLRWDGERRFAHHVIAEEAHGPRPEGLIVCHDPRACTSSLCINPRHLRYDTPAANMADRVIERALGRQLPLFRSAA